MNKSSAIWLACGVLLLGAVFVIWNHNRSADPVGQLPQPQPQPNPAVVDDSPPSPDARLPFVTRRPPDFSLSDQTGAACGSDELFGKAWIACFFATRDLTFTPALMSDLVKLEQEFTKHSAWPNVRLVCITADPEHDTAEVVRNYADKLHADPRHWKFLTGDAEQVRQQFHLGLGPWTKNDKSIGEKPLAPQSQFTLVDPQGHVRGFYDSGSEDAFHNLTRDVSTAIQERVLLVPNLLDPPWLEIRRREQLTTVDQFQVFCDFQFSDQVRQSGIQFRHRCVDDGGRSYVTAHYDHGNGIAVADVDGDGRQDILFVSQVGGNELWRNLGGGKFENITDRAGVALAERIKVTASFADIDNDGDADLYVTTVRDGNVLLENDGHGNFRDITEGSGLGYVGHSSGAVFFDYDRDGLLDLFLVNVGIYTTPRSVPRTRWR